MEPEQKARSRGSEGQTWIAYQLNVPLPYINLFGVLLEHLFSVSDSQARRGTDCCTSNGHLPSMTRIPRILLLRCSSSVSVPMHKANRQYLGSWTALHQISTLRELYYQAGCYSHLSWDSVRPSTNTIAMAVASILSWPRTTIRDASSSCGSDLAIITLETT